MKPKKGETIDQFVQRWWNANPNFGNPELRSNGQFDEVPYAIYEEHKHDQE